MIRSKVVLPDPDGPSKANKQPLGTSRLTRSRATYLPKRLQTFLTVMLILLAPPPEVVRRYSAGESSIPRSLSTQSSLRLIESAPKPPHRRRTACLERAFPRGEAAYRSGR